MTLGIPPSRYALLQATRRSHTVPGRLIRNTICSDDKLQIACSDAPLNIFLKCYSDKGKVYPAPKHRDMKAYRRRRVKTHPFNPSRF